MILALALANATALAIRQPANSLPGAILVPSNPKHTMLKIPWSRSYVQIGRGDPENTVTLKEKRVSNKHCVISPMLPREPRDTADRERMLDQLRNSEAAPEVFIEDKNSSNGTYVSVTIR